MPKASLDFDSSKAREFQIDISIANSRVTINTTNVAFDCSNVFSPGDILTVNDGTNGISIARHVLKIKALIAKSTKEA